MVNSGYDYTSLNTSAGASRRRCAKLQPHARMQGIKINAALLSNYLSDPAPSSDRKIGRRQLHLWRTQEGKGCVEVEEHAALLQQGNANMVSELQAIKTARLLRRIRMMMRN